MKTQTVIRRKVHVAKDDKIIGYGWIYIRYDGASFIENLFDFKGESLSADFYHLIQDINSPDELVVIPRKKQ
jgi:hypothetical protein